MRRRGVPEQSSTLFSFFKPASSPAAAAGPAAGTSKKPQKKQKSSPSTRNDVNQTPTRSRQAISENGSVESVSMETDEATPTPSRQKRPHPPDSDSEGEIGVRKVSSEQFSIS